MRAIKNMKIGTKLVLGFCLMALFSGIIGFVSVWNIEKMSKLDEELYVNMTKPISQITSIVENFQLQRIAMRQMLLVDSEVEIKAQYDKIMTLRQEQDGLTKDFETTILSDEMKAVFEEYKLTQENYRNVADEQLQLVLDGKLSEAKANLKEGTPFTVAAEAEQIAMDKMQDQKVFNAYDKYLANKKVAQQTNVLMLTIALIAIAVGVLLGIVLSQLITTPLKKLLAASHKMTEGDLNIAIDINSKEEIGTLSQSFQTMTDTINDILSDMNSVSSQVAVGSRQVSDASIALAQGATEQASAIQELTASLAEVAAQTKQNAISANKGNEISMLVKKNALKGNAQMKQMLESMSEINQASNNISKIIKVIDEIAFQTNILALNAAVEAARAGQHGKGFAVVAEEVRNLAARSANAAKETTTMIEGSIEKVEIGTKIANDTAEALTRIVEGISETAEVVSKIATSSNDQATAIAQINLGIEQVSQVIEVNSTTAEQSAAASEELHSQADLLKNLVDKFKLKKRGHYLVDRNRYQENESSKKSSSKAQGFLGDEGHEKY